MIPCMVQVGEDEDEEIKCGNWESIWRVRPPNQVCHITLTDPFWF